MSEKMDIPQEIKRVEEQLKQGIKEVQDRLMEQKKVVDEVVREKPLMTLGIVFLAGLTLGALMAMVKSKD